MRRTGAVALLVLAASLAFAITVHGGSAADGGQDWRKRVPERGGNTTDDIREEIRFGREVAARMLSRYGYYDDAAVNRYVNLVGKAVALNAGRPELDFHFGVLDTADINAYAAPGGYVLVTRGALQRMQNEAELAGVLAHEIAHIAERHVVRELNIRAADRGGAAGLAMLIGGTSEAARTAFYRAVDQAMDILLKDGYKREDEVQADGIAVQLAFLAGYDPSGLPRYLELISGLKGKGTDVLDKTHPAYGARIAWIKETMRTEGVDEKQGASNRDRFEAAVKQIKPDIKVDTENRTRR